MLQVLSHDGQSVDCVVNRQGLFQSVIQEEFDVERIEKDFTA